jgi:uncharacterized protein (TIGR03435 family)
MGRGTTLLRMGARWSQWAGMLTAQFGRPVIDKTGLTGKYDFVLKYKGRWDRDRRRRRSGPDAADGSGIAGGAWAEG